MIFIWIVIGIAVLMGIVALVNWWRDEQEKFGKGLGPLPGGSVKEAIPAISSRATPLHPSIDPYLAELRAYLLTPPLPAGPGEMAERVYAHLTEWVNTHLTEDASHNYDVLSDDLLVEPTSRFVDMSRNEAAPPPGYLENLMKEV